ncbi:MAG: hypothetical protein LBV26_08555 [Bacteroidales bacterium]|jgi:hypothetical protein|nr:hypothetical protein [Bacteroidales bacterium]
MAKKKILVDLSILKNIYCGLGQIALIDTNLSPFYASPVGAEKNRAYAATFSYEKHMEAYRKVYEYLASCE